MDGETSLNPVFSIQDESTQQSQSNASGEQQQLIATSAAASFEINPQHHEPGNEPRQPLRALSSTLNMAATNEVLPTGVTLSMAEAEHSASIESTSSPRFSNTRTTALQNFGRSYTSSSGDPVDVASCSFVNTDFLSTIPPENFDYLSCLGCLQLPSANDLSELLRAYFLYIHPHLPLINEGDFWDAYLNRQSSEYIGVGIPLLFFQAMLLVACSVSSCLVPRRSIPQPCFVYFPKNIPFQVHNGSVCPPTYNINVTNSLCHLLLSRP